MSATKKPTKSETRANVDPLTRVLGDEEAVRLRAEVKDLVKQLRHSHSRHSFLEAATQIMKTPTIHRRERKSGLREMTAVALASDWHVEEKVTPESVGGRNRYNLKIADQRIARFFQSIVWNVQHHRATKKIVIRDLILALMGDLITGYIHEDLMQGNALSPVQTLVWLAPRIRDGIKYLLEALDLASIKVPCSYGNHGRTTHKSMIQHGAANSFEWLFYQMLKAEFKDERRVEFEVSESAHQYVQAYGFTLHFHHGDSVRYQGGVGGLGVPLLKAIAPWNGVRRADYHHVGHFHQLSDFGEVLVNGSLIGFGAYSAHIRARFEVPQQMFYLLDSTRGKCQVTPLWVGEAA